SRALAVTKRRRRLTDLESRLSGRRSTALNRPDVLRASSTKPDLASQIFPDADSRLPLRGKPRDQGLGLVG
ncbi:hypothetical protein, partial [Sulfobacillus harzensis]|uniref:hypothetical protein n=1 Tax=Sulfobacillus harzensis TaxID=2729629 RepID=UPI001A9B61C9